MKENNPKTYWTYVFWAIPVNIISASLLSYFFRRQGPVQCFSIMLLMLIITTGSNLLRCYSSSTLRKTITTWLLSCTLVTVSHILGFIIFTSLANSHEYLYLLVLLIPAVCGSLFYLPVIIYEKKKFQKQHRVQLRQGIEYGITLEANEYPCIWQFNDKCPTPLDHPTWVSADTRVKKLVDTFLSPQFFGQIVVWQKKGWFTNRGWFGNRGRFGEIINGYCVLDNLDECELIRGAIERSCIGDHFTMLFVPLNPVLFLDQILSDGHYGNPQKVTIGTKDNKDPLYYNRGQDAAFLKSEMFRESHSIFTYSHDAQFLYEILR